MKATKLKKAVTWVIQIVLAMIFLTMGMAKLSGVEGTIQLFEQIGFGQWFRFVTGAIEVTASILLLFGPYASLGAGLILITMTGAVMTHLWWIGGSILPPLSLGAAAALLMALRRANRRAEELAMLEEFPRKKSA